MRGRSIFGTTALLALAAAFSSADVIEGAPTAEQVIARSVEARGGLSAIRAVQTVRMSGHMAVGEAEMPMTVEIKRPSSFRAEMTLQGRPVVQAYDGQQAWSVAPFGGGEPQALPAEAALQMAQQADLEGPLVDYSAKGNRVELVGREKLDGDEVFRLKLTRKDGDVDYFLIDAHSFLPLRVEATRRLGGRQMEGTTTLGDYKASGGWKWPHTIVNSARGAQGGPEKQTLSFDTVEVNPVIEDSRFRMPARRPSTAPR